MLRQGWLHTKLLLVVVLIVLQIRLYRRVVAIENEPGSAATAGEFRMLHGIISVLLLAILLLAILKPF